MKKLLSIGTISMGIMAAVFGSGFLSRSSTAADGPINLTRVGFKKSTLETSVGKIAVFEAGEGEPLLLLHGVGAGASSFLWFKIAPELAKHYRVIAPDFVGWGESDRPERPILFEDYVNQIRDIGLWIGEPMRVVSQSLSCGFLLSAIYEEDFEVSRLVLHGPAGGLDFGIDAMGEQAAKYFTSIADAPNREELYGQIFYKKPAVEDWYRRIGFLESGAVPEELIEAGHYNAKRPNASYSALPFLNGKIRYDIAPLIEDISVPTLMIWGESETQISDQVRRRLEKLNPKIEVAEISNSRSTFEIERPGETLQVLLPFLETSM